MKTITIGIMIALFTFAFVQAQAQNLPVVDKSDQSFVLWIDYDEDTPLTFGYASPDVGSAKMICFSSMTADVEGNPHGCKLGAYYDTEELDILYVGTERGFVELRMKADNGDEQVFYVRTEDVRFE